MKPVLVLQNHSDDGLGYLGRWLAERGAAVDVRDAEAGHAFPASVRGHAALVLLGGVMSVNDGLPTTRRAQALIAEAMDAGIPVLGHCLGGQLMAKALGARVAASPAPEIGWQPIALERHAAAREWFGAAADGTGPVHVFHWHYEAFELPPGAVRLATSPACPNQAFAIGPHFGMQFHVEVDADKIAAWAASAGSDHAEALAAHAASVQSLAAMRADIARHLVPHQALADAIYGRWWAGVIQGAR